MQDADSTAFAEIVRRYQSLVYAVCRRVVVQPADVDDAFQATFLALARRPRSIRNCRSLTGWLYSVAWRTSMRLIRLRNQKPMLPMSELVPAVDPDPLDVIAQSSEMAALDDELNRLPAKYRDVLVMSYFSGQTSQQIADQLQESKGAVDGRIRQARNMLRIRLARRGVEIAILTTAVSIGSSAAAVPSSALLQATISLGTQAIGGASLTKLNESTGRTEPAGEPATSTFDLTRLEPLLKPELTLMSTKFFASTAACMVLTAGIAGLTVPQLAQSGTAHAGTASETGDSAAGETPALNAVASPAESATAGTGVAAAEVSAGENKAETANPDTTLPGGLGSVGGVSNQIPRPAGKLTPATSGKTRPENRFGGLSSADRRTKTDAMVKLLAAEGPSLDFSGEVSLQEVLGVVSDYLSRDAGMPIPIVPDTVDLSNDGLDGLEAVKMRNVVYSGISTDSLLDLIFEQTSDPQLDYVIRDQMIIVTTRVAADTHEKYMMNRVYPVGEILKMFRSGAWSTLPTAPGGGFGGGGGSGGGFFSIDTGIVQSGPETRRAGGATVAAPPTNSPTTAVQPPALPISPGPGVMPMPTISGGGGLGGLAAPGSPGNGAAASGQDAQDQTVSGAPTSPEARLIEIVTAMTSPPAKWQNTEGEGGYAAVVGNVLMVRQSLRGHRAVVEVLELLEETRNQSAGTAAETEGGDVVDPFPAGTEGRS